MRPPQQQNVRSLAGGHPTRGLHPSAFCLLPSAFRLHRSAFTLAELMVAVAVLAALMVMVATIFATVSKSSGQALSTTTLYRHLRQGVDTIRRDLEKVDPSTRMLAIAGVEVVAYRTPEDRASGRPLDPVADLHRADVLMMLTNRDVEPFVADPNAIIPSGTVQVVYGHADLGELIASAGAGTWQFDPASIVPVETGSMPASQWHLARRVIIFPSQDMPGTGTVDGVADWPLTNIDFLTADADVVRLSLNGINALIPTGIPTGLFHYVNGVTEDCYCVDAAGNGYRHQDGGRYLFHDQNWWRRGQWQGNPEDWIRSEYNPGTNNVEDVPPPVPQVPDAPALTSFDTVPARLFYNASVADRRTIIDPTPPAGATTRMAHYFLPACSEFKVEYTYDDPREIALDSSGNPILLDLDGDGTPDGPAALPVRWQSVPAGQQMVWSKLSVEPTEYGDARDRAFPYRWPRAVRVTLRMYGEGGNLERPITQTVIHTW